MFKVVTIVTDGGNYPDNPGRGGWAALVFEGEPLRDLSNLALILSGSQSKATSNQMELRAALEGLRCAFAEYPGKSFTVVTDSEYLQLGASEWMWKWERNRWRTTEGKPVENQPLWKSILKIISIWKLAKSESQVIQWQHVSAHTGHFANEIADTLAHVRAREMDTILEGYTQ